MICSALLVWFGGSFVLITLFIAALRDQYRKIQKLEKDKQ